MASRTLYRVFRPTSFNDVSGQPQVTDILKKQIEMRQPAHAYLFCGTRGTGKTTTARILANAVNCLHPKDGSPCGECEICQLFREEQFADVTEIDAASNNGVDNIREIREKAALLPIQGKYKVYIIDEAHMLSQGAFNALLKTLEEPPAHTIFILATTELRKIPKTIVSRCQHFDFHRISEKDIEARLRHVAQETGIKAEPKALSLLASQSDGALRDALSLFEQCSAGHVTLTEADVLRTLGLSDSQMLDELTDAIIQGDTAHAVSELNQLLETGTTPVHVLHDLVVHSSDRLAQTARSGESTAIVHRAVDVFIEAQNTLRYSPVPEAVLLSAVVRASNPATDLDMSNLEARLKRLEAQAERAGSTAGAVSKPAENGTKMLDERLKRLESRIDVLARSERQTSRNAEPAATVPQQPEAALPRVDPETAAERFRELIVKADKAAQPAASTIKRVVRLGSSAVLYVLREEESIARYLVADRHREDTLGALSEALEAPVDQVRIESEEPEAQDIDEIMSTLSSVFHDRVTIKDD